MDAGSVSEWDDFLACVGGADIAVAQFLRNEGLSAFNGGEELALAAIRAVTGWWADLDPAVREAINFCGPALGSTARKRLGTIVAESRGVTAAGLAAADVAACVGLFLGVLLPRLELRTLVSASARCL